MKAATLAHKRGLLKALVLETKKLIYTQEDLPVLPPSKPAIPSLKESAKSQPTLYTPQPAETKPIENVIKKSPIEKKSIFDLEKLISKQLNDSSHILSFFKHFFPKKRV